MQHVIEGMDGIEIEHPALKTRHRFWWENPVVGRPIREDAAGGGDQRLFPRECREAVSCRRCCLLLPPLPAAAAAACCRRRPVACTRAP